MLWCQRTAGNELLVSSVFLQLIRGLCPTNSGSWPGQGKSAQRSFALRSLAIVLGENERRSGGTMWRYCCMG